MADVITRFKLETTQYDSKLRDASKGLAEYTRQATLAGNEFGKFTQKNIEAARALGTITPSATNAKDKVKELVGAFNDAAKAYNALTKEQQQSDFGKAMAESISQLSDKIREAKRELYDMGDAAKKSGGGGIFSGMGDKMSGAIQVFAGNMLTKAAGAVANLGSEIFSSVQQGVELARQGEGIRIAFERLGRGDILDGLRQATHGTVTDLELMKAAVKFNDFKLPVEELGTMLAFAQQKAKDTGQSVDYMTESIVNGLGRKSLMILDNLGLSATEIKDKMAETGDMTKAVGAIIREQMSKAGDYVETAADRAAQANVSLQNKMEELGRKFAPVEEASSQLWTSMKIGILDIIGGPLATLLNQLTEAGRLKNQLNNMNGEPGSGNTKVDQQLKKLNVIKKGGGSDYIFNSTLNGMMEDYNRQIMALDTQIKNGGKKPGAKSGESQDVKYLQQKMDALKIMRDQLSAGAKEINKPIKIESNIPDATGGGGGGKTSPKVGSGKSSSTSEPTYASDSIAAQQRLVADLTRKWNEAGADVRNQYVQPLVEAEAKLKKMRDQQMLMKEQAQGKLLGDTQTTTITATVEIDDNEAIEKLRDIDGITIDPKTLSVTADDEDVLAKLREILDKLSEIQGVAIDTKTFTISTDNEEALAKVREIQDLTIAPKTLSVTADTQDALEKLRELKGVHLDESTVQTNTEIQSIEIPISSDVAFEDWMNGIKEQLSELEFEPIQIPVETVGKDIKAITKAASITADVVGSIGDAFNAIEDPAAKVAGTVMQAIASVALGFAQATVQATTMGPWAWIAFAATGLATMISTISAIHSATGYAEGGMIKGNSYSGDNIGGLVDGSQFVGLNAGEVVLNASQQNALAQQITGGGMGNVNLTGRLRGTDIILSVDRSLQSMGRGELLVWK